MAARAMATNAESSAAVALTAAASGATDGRAMVPAGQVALPCDTPPGRAYIGIDGHRRRGVRQDLGPGSRPGSGLGRSLRGPAAACLQLLPLPGGGRRGGR